MKHTQYKNNKTRNKISTTKQKHKYFVFTFFN